MPIVEVLAGFALLLLGGELLVRGAVSLARQLGVSPLFVGLTIVSFGTSAPEMFVCLIAALEGAPAIAVGNVVGSNIANILLILGTAALVSPVFCQARAVRRDGSVLMFASVLFAGLAQAGMLTYWHGLLMLICLVAYLIYSYRTDQKDHKAAAAIVKEVAEMEAPGQAPWISGVKTTGGLVGVLLGSNLLVDGAVVLARDFGISEAVIGLTMIAIGTSLPELATSVIAAYHRHTDLALGNVVGSNIFNILSVMGVVAVATPISVPAEIIDFDLWVLLIVTAGFTMLAFLTRRLGRVTGAIFLLLYIAYVAAQFTGMSGVPGHSG